MGNIMKKNMKKSCMVCTAAISATMFITACTTNVSFDIDDAGHAREVVFPKLTEYAVNNSTTVSPDVIKKIGNGTKKHDLLYLLGAPHFGEANAAREWDYVFKKSESSLCQYKIIFDKDMRAQSFLWKDSGCEKYFTL